MTRTAVAAMEPEPHGVPEDGRPIADKTPWRIPKMQEDRARICIRAAEMRSKGQTYVAIAEKLGLEDAHAAKKCAEVGFGLVPGDDLRAGRRKAAAELDALRRELWEVIEDPGVKVSANGTVVTDPRTGLPALDKDAKVGAIRAMVEVNKQDRVLGGWDPPKLSASMVATGSLEEIQARIAETRREIEQAERDAGDDGDGLAGIAALPPSSPKTPPAAAYADAEG